MLGLLLNRGELLLSVPLARLSWDWTSSCPHCPLLQRLARTPNFLLLNASLCGVHAHHVAQEPEVCFPCVDQYGNSGILRAWLYHPFLEAVKRMCEDAEVLFCNDGGGGATGGPGGGGSSSSSNCPLSPQQPLLDVDLYHASDVSLISLQNSPAACGLQGGEPLLLYRYGRCSREYWQQHDQPERAAKPSFVGIYFSDYKNQVPEKCRAWVGQGQAGWGARCSAVWGRANVAGWSSGHQSAAAAGPQPPPCAAAGMGVFPCLSAFWHACTGALQKP